MARGHIFISYARKDGATDAVKLEASLSREGFTTWRDKRGIDPTQDFTAEIEKAIEAASFVVTCITPDVKRQDSFVRREIGYALATNKPVAVARFQAVVPPISVVNHTYFDLFPEWEPGFSSLAGLLKHPEQYQAPSTAAEDPFRGYLETLYRQIVRYLDKAVIFSLTARGETPILPIKAVSRGDAVAAPKVLLRAFFDQIGVGDEEPSGVYDSLQAAFDKYNGRLLLLGEPGSGKTVSVMAFARDAVARRLEDPEAPLPLLARVSEWDSDGKPSLAALLAKLMPEIGDAISATVASGKALLMLDGLDELPGERKKEGEDDPRQQFARMLPGNNHIILTCRTKEYAAIRDKAALYGAVELRPLEDAQIRTYLGALPELWNLLTSRDELRNVLRVPLLLNLFAEAFAGLRSELTGLDKLETGEIRDAIFERFIRRRYEYEKRKVRHDLSIPLDRFYGHMGALVFSVDPYSYGGGLWRSPEYMKDYLTTRFGDNATAIAEMAVRLNIFHEDAQGIFHFVHLMFRDHFAFRYVVPFLKHETRRVRVAALVVLRDLQDRRAIPLFVSALADASGPARWNAVAGLKKLADPSTVNPLIDRLGDWAQPTWGDAYDQTPPAYWLAAEALTTIGAPAVESLIAALNRTDSQIRGQAADVLGEIGDARAIEPLRAAMAATGPREKAQLTGWREKPVIEIIKATLEKCETRAASAVDAAAEVNRQ